MEKEFEIVWIGDQITTDISPDMQLKEHEDETNISILKNMLKDAGFIFKA